MIGAIKRLFATEEPVRLNLAPARRPVTPLDVNDPRHPINAGWRRMDDGSRSRPVRFRVIVPKVEGLKPITGDREPTNAEFMTGGRGWVLR